MAAVQISYDYLSKMTSFSQITPLGPESITKRVEEALQVAENNFAGQAEDLWANILPKKNNDNRRKKNDDDDNANMEDAPLEYKDLTAEVFKAVQEDFERYRNKLACGDRPTDTDSARHWDVAMRARLVILKHMATHAYALKEDDPESKLKLDDMKTPLFEPLRPTEEEEEFHKFKSEEELNRSGLTFLKYTEPVLATALGFVKIDHEGREAPENLEKFTSPADTAEAEERELAETVEELDPYNRPKNISDFDWSKQKEPLVRNRSKKRFEEIKERERALNVDRDDAEARLKAMELETKEIRHCEADEKLFPIYKKILPILYSLWDNPKTEKDDENFSATNMALKAAGATEDHLIAATQVDFIIRAVQKSLYAVEQECNGKRTAVLAGSVIALTNYLRKRGLDWRMILPLEMHRKILRTLRKSDAAEVVPLRNQIEMAILQPLPYQERGLIYFEHNIGFVSHALSNGNTESINVCIEQLRPINNRIGEINGGFCIRKDDHNFPITDLEQCGRSDSNSQMGSKSVLAYKIELLQLPGWRNFTSLKGTLSDSEKDQIRQRALGIVQDKADPPNLENIPLLRELTATQFAYSNVPMRTVGWGERARSKFFINMYGPEKTCVFRVEFRASPEWYETYGVDYPESLKVSNPSNQYGPVRSSTGPRYGKEHCKGPSGVAFTGTLAEFDPGYYGPRTEEKDYVYVLVRWDLTRSGLHYETKWETPTTCERLLENDIHESLYCVAYEAQENFDQWLARETSAEDANAGPTQTLVQQPRTEQTSVPSISNASVQQQASAPLPATAPAQQQASAPLPATAPAQQQASAPSPASVPLKQQYSASLTPGVHSQQQTFASQIAAVPLQRQLKNQLQYQPAASMTRGSLLQPQYQFSTIGRNFRSNGRRTRSSTSRAQLSHEAFLINMAKS